MHGLTEAAPEVIAQTDKYDAKADIWRCASARSPRSHILSLGITALELSAGRPPNSYYAPAQAMAKTVTEAAPRLDRGNGRFSETFGASSLHERALTEQPSSSICA